MSRTQTIRPAVGLSRPRLVTSLHPTGDPMSEPYTLEPVHTLAPSPTSHAEWVAIAGALCRNRVLDEAAACMAWQLADFADRATAIGSVPLDVDALAELVRMRREVVAEGMRVLRDRLRLVQPLSRDGGAGRVFMYRLVRPAGIEELIEAPAAHGGSAARSRRASRRPGTRPAARHLSVVRDT